MSTASRLTGTAIFLILLTSACTSLQPVEMPPEQLHQRISAGSLVAVGDKVRIVTADNATHTFEVTAVTPDRVAGKGADILIADIVTVETREFSGGKTAALTAAGVVLVSTMAEAIAVASLLGR